MMNNKSVTVFVARSALTLVELLVVVAILVLLVAVVLPLAKPALKGRSAREATRMLAAMLSTAQSRAQATRSYHGVYIKASNATDDNPLDATAYAISSVKMPNPTLKVKCHRILSASDIGLGNTPFNNVYVIADADYILLNSLQLQKRQFIQLGTDQRLFRIHSIGQTTSIPISSWIAVDVLPSVNQSLVAANAVPPKLQTGEFIKVFPVPSKPRYSMSGRIELPVDAYIDLAWSGIGTSVTNGIAPFAFRVVAKPLDKNGITLMFGPDGRVSWVFGDLIRYPIDGVGFMSFSGPFRPDDRLHFLVSNAKNPIVGNERKLPLSSLRPTSGSYWVSIDNANGRVSTSENTGSISNDIGVALRDSRLGISNGSPASLN